MRLYSTIEIASTLPVLLPSVRYFFLFLLLSLSLSLSLTPPFFISFFSFSRREDHKDFVPFAAALERTLGNLSPFFLVRSVRSLAQ